ncbi:hypothetical protein KEJ25_10385 [Candidatus Bathyarchaeota archaeon]|nr:hypothetical protein [Candidatus Bathyarchaeota archaeon]
MIKVRLECRNVSSEKVANCLSKFGRSFPFAYEIKSEGDQIVAEFSVNSTSALNELTRRLKHIKGLEFKYSKILSVVE